MTERTPVERLRAAAERLETLDDEATQAPWLFGRSAIDDTVLRFREAELAVVFMDSDARLIATLRPLAPILAKHLRATLRHVEGLRSEDNQQRGIEVFSPYALTLADAVLGDGS